MALWQILFCLTVLSFCSRAFIPVGYMPDASGKRDATFAVTLCAMGGGSIVMQMDFSGDPDKAPSDESYGDETCPFGPNLAHKLAPGQDTAVPVEAASFFAAVPPARFQALPPLPALGPPLGSRAPPVFPGRLQA